MLDTFTRKTETKFCCFVLEEILFNAEIAELSDLSTGKCDLQYSWL